jgi:Mrp family chromosome partitioning ATPase
MDTWEEKFARKKKENGTWESQPIKNNPDQGEFPKGMQLSELANKIYIPNLKKMHKFMDETWANILLESKTKPDSLMICGAIIGEGCTFISFHLSLFLALEYNMKILYVDSNIGISGHQPIISPAQDYSGLSSYFYEDSPLSSLILHTEYENFFVLPAGPEITKREKGRNLFNTESLDNLIRYCRDCFELTIFDGQPLINNPCMIGFAKAIVNVVLVCRYKYSRRKVSIMAIEKLRNSGIPLLGVILNDRQYPVPSWVYKIL